MKWNYIMHKQPADGEEIIQCDRPYQGHYCMCMRKYVQGCLFKEILEYNKKYDWPDPDFWWISAKDFPFPDKDTQ